MGRVAGVIDDPPGFPYTPPGVDILEGGKLTSNNVAGSSHNPLQSFAVASGSFYAIKKSIQIEIPIRIWLKIFQSVIEPIALYGSEVWGPLLNHKFAHKFEEALHAEFCKSILRVQRNTPNNACRAELGQYPLLFLILETERPQLLPF